MSDEADFLRAICLAPDDDAPRLIFADWLDENGQPERAEFIRLGCEYERIDIVYIQYPRAQTIKARLNHLWHEFGHLWGCAKELGVTDPSMYGFTGTRCETATIWIFRRGLVDWVELPLAEFMAHAQTIALTHPVRKWVLTDVREYQGSNGVSLWDHETFAIKSPEPNMGSIPRSLFRYLRRGKRFKADRGPIRYKSSALAIADLQQACYHYAREGLLALIKAPATPLAG